MNGSIPYQVYGPRERIRAGAGDVSIDDQSIGSYSYNYYTTGPNKHRLENETAPSGHETNYAYDNEGNITTIDEVIDGESIETTYEYDEKGKPTRKIYPSGFAIRYVYDEKEYLKKIVSDDNSLIIWEVNHINAQNKLTNYTLGNGLTVDYDYNDEYFYPESYQVTAGSDEVISFDYTFDEVTGNLKMRNLGASNEYFFYDENGLNRLIGAGPAEDEIEEEYTIAPNGNILEKENVGVYSYHEIKKFAVSKIELNGGIEEADLTYITGIQSITYNHFNSAASITNSDDQIRLDIEYGPDNQRRIGKYYDISGQNDVWLKSRIYAGSYERQEDAIGNEIEVHYISAGDHLVALYVIENGDAKYFYPHLDHLGSILYITDESGNLLEDDYGNIVSQPFDAWGRPRNPDDLSYEDIPEIPSWLWRGYTGHEHLYEFGLVNMNGRLYDPVVGRMLSPDNYVQSPDFSQSYNRYSYVWNNPLKYNDPSGEFVQYIIGAVLGGINGYLTGKSAGLEGGALFLSTIAGAGIGLATAGVGTIVSNSSGVLAAGMVGGYVNGAGNGLLTSVANGQDFDATISNTFMSAGKGAISGAAGGVVGGAIGGGSGAFFGGATSGALGTAMNGGSKDDVLRGAIVGGAASFGAYHINGMVAYSKYEKSGVTFDGNKLYYKQFMGMGADFQRSRFYKREHGGMLLSDGTIDRSAVLLRGKDYILWDPEGAKVGTWGYYHAHHGEPGTPAPNGGFWLPHHSPDDMMGTYSTNLESLVINPSNTYYKPSSYNPSNLTNTSGLSNYNLGLQRSFTFPYFGFW